MADKWLRALTGACLSVYVLAGASRAEAQAAPVPAVPAAPVQAPAEGGRIAGLVVDAQSGRPVGDVDVSVAGTAVRAKTDLAGRYRLGPLADGRYSVTFRLLGFTPLRKDSVAVSASKVTTLNATLTAAAVELQEVVVTSAAGLERTNSAAGLLAMQQASAAAADGVSEEQIQRTPDGDAGQAVARISGVSTTGGKFIVVRGLDERYTSTLLNGTEVASAEPLKRVVPLDVFQANLLESIVTTKSALPDRPGDFAGASLDVKTKDFPDAFTASVKLSQEWNSQTTFLPTMVGPRNATDFLGFDGQARGVPGTFPLTFAPQPGGVLTDAQVQRQAAYASQIRNVWTPTPSSAAPNTGFSASLGNASDVGEASRFGWIASLNYSNQTQALRDRIFRIVDGSDSATPYPLANRIQQGTVTVDWGGILNLSYQAGGANRFGLRNFLSRNAEETFAETTSFFNELNSQTQTEVFNSARFITRQTWQSQLWGEHRLIGQLRFDWKASYSEARRDEPENRTIIRSIEGDGRAALGSSGGQFLCCNFTHRFLTDRTTVGQADLSLPFTFWTPGDGLIKVGVLRRDRIRDFVGARVFGGLFSASGGIPVGVARDLPIERFWSPELFAGPISLTNQPSSDNSYGADDRVRAAYGMLDFVLVPRVRLAGGLRYEQWSLDVFAPSRPGQPLPGLGTADSNSIRALEESRYEVRRANTDMLPSANLTFMLSDRMNVRLAAFQSLARPDARELSREVYQEIGGDCSLEGNETLQRTLITNYDAKWELFTRPGEIFSLSGFYKRFQRPTVQVIGNAGQGRCQFRFAQASEAETYGGEVEMRQQLTWLPGALSHLSLGGNVSLIRSKAILDSVTFGPTERSISRPFQGQSDWLANVNLGYDAPGGFQFTVLYNWFGDRVLRYDEDPRRSDQIERGRGTLDARLRFRLGDVGVSVAGRNLTDNEVIVQQQGTDGVVRLAGYQRFGRAIQLQLGYAF
ncbi:MAG: carboxypeptidase regulatory-like domain-containing protein [Gemmatimonadales bacterium]|nr:carboxypeptidase regulatory-like domain-containing protein [Gemmatimonadales bacterium]